ncbi:MAG: ABC transporter ATP-binding protein [Actinomycetota bacterium]|nr:ABC transporter ATP-binding protein [Actinomycetota bacterium]
MNVGLSLGALGLRRDYRGGFSLAVDELHVPAGSTLALLGPSGSGKSTLLSLLGLLEKPDAGSVQLDGREVTTRDHEARLSMAAVFQRPYLIKGTVAANVAYGLALRRVPAEERARRVDAALERVGLDGLGDRAAAALSGGEAQRVALARALVLEPQVLLLDEPLASLDPLLKRQLTGEFASILRSSGSTVVWVTHDQDETLVVSDSIAVMRDGRIVAHGPTEAVMALPKDEWTAKFLGQEVPIRGRVASGGEGLAEIVCGSATILAVSDAEPGTEVLVAVAPEDVVLLAGDAEMPPSSARNRLRGFVDEVSPRGSTWRVVVQIDGVRIASVVSRAALAEMGLAPGAAVQVLFKATAVRVRRVETERVE